MSNRYKEACRRIVALSAGFDEDGSTGPKEPLSWQTVGNMAIDYARYAVDGPCRSSFVDDHNRRAVCRKRKGHDGECVGINKAGVEQHPRSRVR